MLQESTAQSIGYLAKKNRCKERTTLYFIIAIFLSAGYSQSITLTVCPDGCDYASLQDAIDAANPGDAIEVYREGYPSSDPIFQNVWIGGIRIDTIPGSYKWANDSFAKSEEISLWRNQADQIRMTAEGPNGQARVIDASEITDKVEKNVSLDYDNYTIVGYFSLPNKIDVQAHFNNTNFLGPVDFYSIIFGSDAYFRGARFNGDAHFDRTIFNRTADFRGARFNGDASFIHSSFNRTADFRDAVFNQSDGSWDSHFWFSRFNGDALFSRSHFNGIADFWNSEFNGKADFSNSKFNYAKFQGSKFGGDAFFPDSVFNGTAIFMDSNFNGTAYFKNSIFNGAVTFRNSLFNKGGFFGGSIFNGDAIFIDSNFNDVAEFFDTKFNWHAYFICDFNGMALFRSQFNKDAKFGLWEGEAIISRADPTFFKRFNGVAQFSGTIFNGDAYFRGLQFNEKANFEWCKFNKNADFNMSEFNGNTYFKNAKFFGILNLTKIRYNYLEIYWQDIKRLVCNDGPTYLTLIKYFRETEQYEASDDVYFQYRDWRRNQRNQLDWQTGLDNIALYTCGYGVRPGFTIWSGITVLLIYAMLYYCLIFEMSFSEAFWLSVLALLSLPKELGPFDDTYYKEFMSRKTIDIHLIRFAYIIERLIGWALLLVFITTLSRVMIRY